MAEAAEVEALPQLPLEDDDDADDQTFAKEYRESEVGMLLTAKEADFRNFLCDSGAANEIVRLLVGLGESADPPADPVAFLRAKFDAQELPEMVTGKQRDDIPALLELNASLHEQVSTLSSELETTLAEVAASDAAAAAPLLQGLVDGGKFASESIEGALDVAKLYAAVSARFPPPAEAGEEEAEPPPPQPWAAEGALAPVGTATAESLTAWAAAAFGYGSAIVKAHGAELTLALLVAAAAAAEEECEVDEAKGAALYAACVLLVDFTEEVKEPPPEEGE